MDYIDRKLLYKETFFTKARVNPQLCSGTGLCVSNCPKAFELKGSIATIKVNEIRPKLEKNVE